MDRNNHLTLSVQKDQVPYVEEFERRCASHKLSPSYVMVQLIKQYLTEDIYVGGEEPQDQVVEWFVQAFKRLCPGWSIPDITPSLRDRIVSTVTKKPKSWWEELLKKAFSIPDAEFINFLWVLNLENCFKINAGQYDWKIRDRESERRAEERRKQREAERLEKERIKKEEADHKAQLKKEETERKTKEKAELERIKLEKAQLKVKEKAEREACIATKKKKEEPEEEEFLPEVRDPDVDAEKYAGNVEFAED